MVIADILAQRKKYVHQSNLKDILNIIWKEHQVLTFEKLAALPLASLDQ